VEFYIGTLHHPIYIDASQNLTTCDAHPARRAYVSARNIEFCRVCGAIYTSLSHTPLTILFCDSCVRAKQESGPNIRQGWWGGFTYRSNTTSGVPICSIVPMFTMFTFCQSSSNRPPQLIQPCIQTGSWNTQLSCPFGNRFTLPVIFKTTICAGVIHLFQRSCPSTILSEVPKCVINPI